MTTYILVVPTIAPTPGAHRRRKSSPDRTPRQPPRIVYESGGFRPSQHERHPRLCTSLPGPGEHMERKI